MSCGTLWLVPVLVGKSGVSSFSKKADDLQSFALPASCMPSKHPHLTQQELTEFREIFNLVRCCCHVALPHRY